MAYPGIVLGAGLILAVGVAAFAFIFGKMNTAYENEPPRQRSTDYAPTNSWEDEDNEVRKRRKTVCSICLERMKNGQCTMILKCNHAYHRKCLDLWIRTQSTCPLCRQNVSSEDLIQC